MKPRTTISFDRDLYQVLLEESSRRSKAENRKISLPFLVNEVLGDIYAERVAKLRKERLYQVTATTG